MFKIKYDTNRLRPTHFNPVVNLTWITAVPVCMCSSLYVFLSVCVPVCMCSCLYVFLSVLSLQTVCSQITGYYYTGCMLQIITMTDITHVLLPISY